MEPTGQPAESLVGRTIGSYRVDELIGTGGMGEVYRARDLELPRDVALKAMRGSRSTDDASRARFVRETRLAAQVSHPYVATVLGVEEHDEDLFLVMEYVEGRRLDRVVHDDSPDKRELTRLGVEMAQALGAIHDAGLIHRDLKPGNVMVRPDGHVKVLDFGVARQQHVQETSSQNHLTMPTAEATLTQDGAAVGTMLYMSPEQLRSEKIDPRSDLFALGVVLYEAITGEHPFMRPTPSESVSAILKEAPGRGSEPQTLTGAGALREVVHRLLEKDPDRRYQSAADVAADLQDALEGKRPHRAPRRSKRAIGAAAAVAVVLALAVAAWIQLRPAPSPPGRDIVAVLPFADETGERNARTRGETLAELLAADLAETRHLRSLGHDRLSQILEASGDLSGQELIEHVQRVSPVRWIVVGRLFRPGDTYDVVMDIYQTGEAEPHDTLRVSAARSVALIDLATVGLLPRMGYSEPDDPTPRPQRVSTTAMDMVFRAKEAIRRYEFAEAIRLLESAVREEPRYLAGQTWLAWARHKAGYGDAAREAAQTVHRLLEGDLAQSIGKRQALESRAVHAAITQDSAVRESILRELADLYPDDPRVLYELAAVQQSHGSADEALSVIERAVGLDPTDPWLPMMQGRILVRLERFDDAEGPFERALELCRDLGSAAGEARVQAERGHSLWHQGDYTTARERYREAVQGYELAGLEVLSAQSLGNVARTLLMEGDLEAAERTFDQVIPELRVAGNYRSVLQAQNALASVWFRQGDLRRAERLFTEAAAGAEELGNPRALAQPLGSLAKVKVLLGRLGEARGTAERALEIARELEWPMVETKMLRILADIEYQQGNLGAAADGYRDLLEMARPPDGTAEERGYSLGGLAEVFHAGSRLAEALEVTDRSIVEAEAAGGRGLLAFMRVRRAYLLGELGEWSAATEEIAKAEDLVGSGEQRLAGADARLRVTEAAIELFRGDWTAAEQRAALARGASEGLGPQLEVPALILSSEAALRLDRERDAARMAEAALSFPGVTAVDRTQARVALARALRARQKYQDAAETASHALDEAESMQVPFSAARAAAVICELPPEYQPRNLTRVRERGRTELEKFLDLAPDGSRARLAERVDVKETMRALQTGEP